MIFRYFTTSPLQLLQTACSIFLSTPAGSLRHRYKAGFKNEGCYMASRPAIRPVCCFTKCLPRRFSKVISPYLTHTPSVIVLVASSLLRLTVCVSIHAMAFSFIYRFMRHQQSDFILTVMICCCARFLSFLSNIAVLHFSFLLLDFAQPLSLQLYTLFRLRDPHFSSKYFAPMDSSSVLMHSLPHSFPYFIFQSKRVTYIGAVAREKRNFRLSICRGSRDL